MKKLTFRPIEGLFGRPPATDEEVETNRWLIIVWPWSGEHRKYESPLCIEWYGKKWCWGFRPFSGYQQYNWKHRHFDWDKKFRKFSWYPADYRTRKSTCGDCWRERMERRRRET